MVNELGQSHPGPVIVTNLILSALHSDPRFQVELYWEDLNSIYLSEDSVDEQRDLLVRKYQHRKLDLIVLLGPDPIRLLEEPANAVFPDVPVVFCCSTPEQIDQMGPHPQFTGSWFQLEPAKTVDVALRLLPKTRNLFVIGGQSGYDRRLTAIVNAGLVSYENKLNVTYLTDLPMSKLRNRLKHLPDNSIVLYLSFYKDVQGQEFLNAAEALPTIVAASNAPVFSISDTYLGRGIVGGFVVSFEEQGKIASRDALDILGGKSPQDIPIVHGPSVYMFDERELRHWKLDESKLPAGSTILFRQPTLWEQHKWTLLTGSLIIVGLGLLTVFLLFKQKQLNRARKAQEQLSGMLLNAQEQERTRLAAEIHDDFSQRLAVLSLGLETTAEGIPESMSQTHRHMLELMESASELGSDLHTLSHQLHSSTLERLGLVAGVGSFCKEFTAQRGPQVAFSHLDVPRSVSPEVALCLFRIVQEGLRNVQKHSGAAEAQVRLEIADGMLHLSISDDGAGFDAEGETDRRGIGIWSMRERVRTVGGRFEIHSEKQKGTRIDVWAPIEPTPEATPSKPDAGPFSVSVAASPLRADSPAAKELLTPARSMDGN
ncbi:MAG: ATP-binding protein [Candidatus Korobacteraceae bacterium]|jgi:signal transduction histidine kinase